MSVLVDIQHVSKKYKDAPKAAINDLSLTIQKGEIFGLLGPNGAGKTTFISMLCGLFPPGSGEILINGRTHKTHSKECKQVIGVVPQEIALYPQLTAWENLMFLGHMYGLSGSTLKEKIQKNLKILGLEANIHQKLISYSGGMKRRLNLIAGLLHDPQLLILDEPTVGVDIQSKQAIIEHLKKLNKENGMTILYTSHHLDEAEDFCSYIAIIDQGQLITQGQPKELIIQNNCNSVEEVYLKMTGVKFRD
ncbi:MAG: transporter ATP-binding protein [Bacteroidetes bacterium]|jgi:ABC-2 type transport system ATP-binding protein|nr:transporter ATP-binding protein [Bacteroidota bacterium]MDF2450886.1 transporter ATP-binding protein [Bacteroidota bacterium]